MRARRHGLPLQLLASIALTWTASGCVWLGLKRPPVPPPISRQEVVALLQQRAPRIFTVTDTSASLRVDVVAEGKLDRQPTVGVVLAFDAMRPGLWLRAEKLGQKIFSLRAGADYFWLEVPDTREVIYGSMEAYGSLPQLIHPHEIMFWLGPPERLGLTWPSTTMSVEEEEYRFEVPLAGMPLRTVYVDRRAVAVSRIVTRDAFGRARAEVLMDDYKKVGDALLPHSLVVNRRAEGYILHVRLGSPILNKQLDAAIFKPLERPGWDHINLDREPVSRVKAFGGGK
jgi:hypothetical protein